MGTRAGPMCVISSDKLFALGGAGTAGSETTTFSQIRATGVDLAFTNTGAFSSPMQSTANAFPSGMPRALGAWVTGGADFRIGPGFLGADVRAAFSKLDHALTGSTNAGKVAVAASYRFVF